MRRRLTAIIFVLTTGIIFSGCASQQKLAFKSVEGKTHSAVTPVQQTAKWAALWIGDSITHGWENRGKKIWDTYYAPRNAVNMGFSGDRTEHVLWRLDHSSFENISPKLAIIMIGTNNSNGEDNTAEEIADGIITICQRLRTQFPKMKILLLAIFPRNPEPSAQREKNAEASLLASRVADGRTIYYMDINQKFLTDDGTLTKDIMPDFLHPNETGYKIWAEAIESKVAELMGE
jgi:beta-glucosidase